MPKEEVIKGWLMWLAETPVFRVLVRYDLGYDTQKYVIFLAVFLYFNVLYLAVK